MNILQQMRLEFM